MAEVVIKVDIPSEFKEEFELALAKVVKQFVKQLRLSIINEISEISEDDKREVRNSVVKEVVNSIEETSKKLESGEIKPTTLSEFNKWCDSI
ncbi:hypothetical protein KAR52_03005 [Candidatus Pacearchaeota archaeon]|nr:hypothetical protein [Candidatus Pacearchaeota archaeon]